MSLIGDETKEELAFYIRKGNWTEICYFGSAWGFIRHLTQWTSSLLTSSCSCVNDGVVHFSTDIPTRETSVCRVDPPYLFTFLLSVSLLLTAKMPRLRDVRDCLLLSHDQNLINDEELLLLYDMNTSKNPDFCYWQYPSFDLDRMNDDECKAEFRFLKNDVLQEVLRIPDEYTCSNRLIVTGIEATCILLKRFAYPCRFGDMIPRFARPEAQIGMIAGELTSFVYTNHHHRLETLNQPWLSAIELERFALAPHCRIVGGL